MTELGLIVLSDQAVQEIVGRPWSLLPGQVAKIGGVIDQVDGKCVIIETGIDPIGTEIGLRVDLKVIEVLVADQEIGHLLEYMVMDLLDQEPLLIEVQGHIETDML